MKKIFFISLFISFFFSHYAQNKQDSIRLKLDGKIADTTRVNLLVSLGKAYIDFNVDSTFHIATKARKLASKSKFLRGEMMALNLLGNIEQRRGNMDTALIIYGKVKEIAEDLHDDKGFAIYYNNVGVVYTGRGEYEKALKAYLDALGYEKKLTDTIGIAEAYNNIGVVHYYMGDMKNTLVYLKKSTELTKEVGDLQILKKSYINIGAIHQYNQEYDEALNYYQKGYDIAVEVNDHNDINLTLHNMAQVYVTQKEYKKAESYYLKSLAFQEKFNNQKGMAFDYSNLGGLYSARKEYSKAEKYYYTSIDISKQNGYLKELEMAYKGLSEFYSARGQFEKAYEASVDYIEVKDSLLNEENVRNFAELRTKYETAEKEVALAAEVIKSESFEKEAAQAKLLAANKTKWIIVLIAGIIGSFLIFMTFSQRLKRKAQAEKDIAIIKERDRGMEAVIKAQEEERKRISKDLHDGVGQQLSGLKMAFQNVSNKIEKDSPERGEELKKIAAILSESADEVRSISHQMMPKALTELGLVEAIEDMLEKCFHLSNIEYEFDHFGINSRLPENIEVSLYRVAQELVSNIIKHSEAKRVNVQLFKNQDKVIMVIEDNGKGLKESKTSGHGLLNIRSRINTLKGEINLEPSPTSGTLATVRVPLA